MSTISRVGGAILGAVLLAGFPPGMAASARQAVDCFYIPEP